MKIIITGRKMDVTDALHETINKKVGKLSKFFDEDTIANVTLSVQKDRYTIEVTIHHKGIIFRAEETQNDMYAAIDLVIDVLERQIRKNKTRLSKKLKESAFVAKVAGGVEENEVEEESEFKIVKTKHHFIKPMSHEEAILQMNLLGHQFFVFSDADTFAPAIVYKRKDGNYGLIEISNS